MGGQNVHVETGKRKSEVEIEKGEQGEKRKGKKGK